MNRLRRLLPPRDSGQVLIFFAILVPVLFGFLGLAIEGGRVFIEHRNMQAAADMAALLGAQDLPNNTTQAISDACLFSQRNGYDNCTTGGTSTTTVCVPPKSLSPYNGLNYESDSTCSNSATRAFYIEVQIQKTLQLFPLFANFLGVANFTLSAHAIAREGAPSPTDYAITVLDRTQNGALTMTGGKGVVLVGPAISDSSSSSSIATGGTQPRIACNGTWSAAGPETTPATLYTQSGGTTSFSPPDCFPVGNYDNPTGFFPNQAPVPDPYCASDSPPIQGLLSTDCNGNPGTATSMTNCTPCNSTAWYYQWMPTTTPPDYGRNSGTWLPATGSIALKSISYELFPGIYQGDITVDTGQKPTIYLNPGVYTIEGTTKGFDAHGGNMCIYGSPACDIGIDLPNRTTIPYTNSSTGLATTANCSTADMTTRSAANYVDPNVWYYYCSPWGIWDASLARTDSFGNGPTIALLPKSPPTFTDNTKNVPLNGVTFYLSGGGSFNMNGTNFMYAAFPNPCPGTGTLTTESLPVTPGQVSFQSQVNPTATGLGQPGWSEPTGAQPGQPAYVYPAGSLPNIDGVSDSSTAWVYPNTDFTMNGECERYNPSTYAGDVWQGEMPAPSGFPGLHVHFLVFARNAATGVLLNGNGQQNWWGILYDPAGQGCGNACQVTLTGSAGGGGGPPMLIGQIVADNAKISGTATVEVFYRPCDPEVEACGSGAGSGLVQ